MSDFSMPQGASPAQPKQISNRLLNMKFMQRASASITQKEPKFSRQTLAGEPAPKRRRTGDFVATVSNLNSPSATSAAVSTPSYSDRTAPSGALSAEVNGIPIRRETNDFDTIGEETEWVLDVRLPVAKGVTKGVTNGFTQNYEDEYEDESDEDNDEIIWASTDLRGRQTYGSFDKKKKRKTADSTPGVTTTIESGSVTKKRRRLDAENDEDLSSISSNSESNDNSEGEIVEDPVPQKKKGEFNFRSEADLKKMDAFDFQKAGVEHALGRQRRGLAGGGGGGGGSMGGVFGSPRQVQEKHRKKVRKTM